MQDIVVITGGSKGLGSYLVREAIQRGFIVCNLSRHPSSFTHENYYYFEGDISDEAFIKKSVLEISKLGHIKYLFNNACTASFKAPTLYEKEDITKCFKGLEGMILLSTHILRQKEEQNLKIINIMSSAALHGNKGESLYCACKWGERGYTESLKETYKGTSVKVIGVYPGGMNTDFFKNSRDYVSEEKQKSFMHPEEVAQIICENVFSNCNLTVSDIIIERN